MPTFVQLPPSPESEARRQQAAEALELLPWETLQQPPGGQERYWENSCNYGADVCIRCGKPMKPSGGGYAVVDRAGFPPSSTWLPNDTYLRLGPECAKYIPATHKEKYV